MESGWQYAWGFFDGALILVEVGWEKDESGVRFTDWSLPEPDDDPQEMRQEADGLLEYHPPIHLTKEKFIKSGNHPELVEFFRKALLEKDGWQAEFIHIENADREKFTREFFRKFG